MSKFINAPLMVSGAAGKLGRLVVEDLLARGATRIIAGTRDPAQLQDLAARGVEPRRVDFDDPASLGDAFAGVERLLIISTDAVGRRIAQHRAAVEAAKAAGVKHIIYTSGPAVRPHNVVLYSEHFWTEVAIAQSGLDFTILRNHIYAENNLMDGPQAISSGQLFGLIGDRGTAWVTRADTARTAAGALLAAEGQAIEDVTGPAAVTNVERAALFSQLSGKPVSVVALTPADLVSGMVAAGLPEDLAQALVAFQRDAVTGYHAVVTDAVERYSGRKPTSLADFLAANRSALGL